MAGADRLLRVLGGVLFAEYRWGLAVAYLDVAVLDQVENAFGLLCAGPDPLGIDGRGVPGLPERVVPLTELRDLLLDRGRVPTESRDAAWSVIVRRAQCEGPAWVVGVTGMALPRLRTVTRRLATPCPGQAADIAAEVLTGFVTALRRVDPDAGGVISRLGWAAYRAGLSARTIPDPLVPAHTARIEPAPPPAPAGHPDVVLARAVASGVITRAEAELIGVTRLEDVSLAEVARRAGARVDTVKHRRQRAERRLVTAIRSGNLSEPCPRAA